MRHLLLASMVSSTLAIAGCTDVSNSGTGGTTTAASAKSLSSSGKTAAERDLEKQVQNLDTVTRNIVVSNTVQGAALGALAGCGLALMLGGDGGDCARGAVAGGVVGGVAGNQVGQAAAEKKREMVQRDQVLAKLKGVSAKLDDVEVKLQSVLKSQNAELASLRRQVQANQVSQTDYNTRLKAINSNRQTVQSGLAKSEANIVKTRQEIQSATKQGQSGLGPVDQAAASTQQRLERNRKLIALAN